MWVGLGWGKKEREKARSQFEGGQSKVVMFAGHTGKQIHQIPHDETQGLCWCLNGDNGTRGDKGTALGRHILWTSEIVYEEL